ncbi:MAG: hypothetical protein IMZ52_00305 [Actinobacteria bacterium]|nr:hypothetical protein [Actinomycetota bacterium]
MKNVLHLQIPTPYGEWKPEILGKFMNIAKSALGNNWAIIVSPCSPSVLLDDDTEFRNFQLDNITKEELFSLLSK